VPGTLTKEVLDEFELVSADDAYAMCRQLAAKEGVLVGISSGAVACALKRLADKQENEGKMLVGAFVDSGQSYLSVKALFFDALS
jgi:cysteine synthase A